MADVDDAEGLRGAEGLDVLVEEEPGVVEAEVGGGGPAAREVEREVAGGMGCRGRRARVYERSAGGGVGGGGGRGDDGSGGGAGVGEEGDVVADGGAGAVRGDGVGERDREVELQVVGEEGDEAEGGGEAVVVGGSGRGGVVGGVGEGEAADVEGEHGARGGRGDGEDGGQVAADAAALAPDLLLGGGEQGPGVGELLAGVGDVRLGVGLGFPAGGDGVPPGLERGLQVVPPPAGGFQAPVDLGYVSVAELDLLLGHGGFVFGLLPEYVVDLGGDVLLRGQGVLDGGVEGRQLHERAVRRGEEGRALSRAGRLSGQIEGVYAVVEMEDEGIRREALAGQGAEEVEAAEVDDGFLVEEPVWMAADGSLRPDLDGDYGRSGNVGPTVGQVEEEKVEVLCRQWLGWANQERE